MSLVHKMDFYEELNLPLDDNALGEISTILKSLTSNGSLSHPPRLINDGSPSSTEWEKYKQDMMEQRAQMTTFMETFEEMQKVIHILQKESEENHSKIAHLQTLLASEREAKAEMEAKVTLLNGDFQMAKESLISIIAANEQSINKSKENSKLEISKVDETIDAKSNLVSNEIESKFTDINEKHARLSDDFQRLKESVEESNGKMENKMCALETESKTKYSEINTNLQSQIITSEKKVKAEMEMKVNQIHGTIQKTLNVLEPLTTRTVATEESINKLKEDSSQEITRVDEAIKEIHNKFSKEIQRLKESVEESDKRIQSKFKISQLSFSMVDDDRERVRDELRNIKVAIQDLEKRMQSETQLTAAKSNKNPSTVSDEIQQLNLTSLESRHSEVLLTPAASKDTVDGSDNDTNVLVRIDDEAEEKEDHAIPQEQEILFTLSSVASKYKASGTIGREIATKTKESSDCPCSTTHGHDITKRGWPVFSASENQKSCCNGGEVKNVVHETSKDFASSPPTPSSSKSSSVMRKRFHHGKDPTRPNVVEKKHICKQCNKGFVVQSRLTKHVLKFHKSDRFTRSSDRVFRSSGRYPATTYITSSSTTASLGSRRLQ